MVEKRVVPKERVRLDKETITDEKQSSEEVRMEQIDVDDASRRIFHALKLRDYARIDYRLTPGSELVFLEANPNPDLARHTFGRDRCFAGVHYP